MLMEMRETQGKHNTSKGKSVCGKSHRKSSRWFLPFSVFYRSIAVGCELSLRLEMRTYKNDVRLYCVGFSTLAVVEMLLDPQTEGFSGPPCLLGM